MRPRAHELESKIRSLFCDSLRECESGLEATGWLTSRDATNLIEELAAENDRALSELEQTSKPKVAILNRPELIHYAAILGASEKAMRQLLRSVESPLVVRFFPLSGIWRNYAAAVVNFHRRTPAKIELPEGKGFEKYYVPYIAYMCAADPQEADDARVAIAEGFEARNRDRRLKDWLGLDGDGERPVRWDSRCFAIDAGRAFPPL